MRNETAYKGLNELERAYIEAYYGCGQCMNAATCKDCDAIVGKAVQLLDRKLAVVA